MMKVKAVTCSVAACLAITVSTGCGTSGNNTNPTEDNSASGAAAGAVGGALSGSSSTGTQAFLMPHGPATFYSYLNGGLSLVSNVFAASACPTFKTTGTGCTASGSSMWLSYSSCSFGSSTASWSGTQSIIASTGAAACGTFPAPSSGTLTRQFVAAASSVTPSTATVTSSFGTITTIDNSTSNIGNYNGDTIAVLPTVGGYGQQVTFSAGARTAVNLQERIYSTGNFDHSISGSLTITEAASASTRTLSGTIKVYHNLLKVIGSSVFNTVTHSDSCCYPTGGSITTTFAAGTVTPTNAGSAYVGKNETLTFSSTCGSATFVNTSGASSSVTLSRCF